MVYLSCNYLYKRHREIDTKEEHAYKNEKIVIEILLNI